MDLPDNIGIMVLPGVVFFPHNLIPLHIFEPRYRLMLQLSLNSHRMLALCLASSPSEQPVPHPIGGVGLIRACVQNKDGTSSLILQGTHRVRFKSFAQNTPFYSGKPVPCPLPTPVDSRHARHLVNQTLKTVRESSQYKTRLPEELFKFLSTLQDYHALVDIIAGSFIHCANQKQRLLESEDLEQRLTLLIQALKEEQIQNC